jgi:GNAT superfamily N-acetyltransferase
MSESDATVSFDVVSPAAADARAALAHYFAELDTRFDGGFDAGETVADDVTTMSPPTGLFVVAYRAGVVVGCGGVKRHDDETAEIKRMWVAPTARGVRLGVRLLQTLEQRAADLGYSVVVLDTNRVLLEAVAMYRRSGYQAIERYNDNPYAHHWFMKALSHG